MQIKNSRILQLHAAFQILGVITQAHHLAEFLSQWWKASHHIDGLASWAGEPTPLKIESMLEYGLLLTIGAAVIVALFAYTQRNKQCIEINRSGWTILGAYELACLFCSFSAAWIFIGGLLPVWLYLRNLPPQSILGTSGFIALTEQSISAELAKRLDRFSLAWLIVSATLLVVPGVAGLALLYAHRPFAAYSLFALCGVVFVTAGVWISFRLKPAGTYRPLIATVPILIGILPLIYALCLTPSRVPNEFLALPEETILSNGQHVDNISYINKNNFEGLYIPDPRESLLLPPPFSVEINRNADTLIIKRLQGKAPERYWYNQNSGRLEIHGPMSDEDYRTLLFVVSENEKKLLNEKYVADKVSSLNLSNRRYHKEELEFFQMNREELERKLVLGRFFYHHVFLFGPVLSGILDSKVTSASQYGRGLTEFFSLIIKFSPENIRFNNYLTLLYLGYPLYLCILVLIAVGMGLGRWPVMFVCSIALIGFLNSNIETVRLGVGLVPWRHLFDVIALYCLFIYVRKPSAISGLFLTAITGLSLYWSREMGLFLAIAVMFGIVLNAIISRSKREWIQAGALILIALICYRMGNPNARVHATAALLGINTPPLPLGFVQLLAGLQLIVGAAWWSRRPTTISKDIAQYTDWIFLGSALVYIAFCGVYVLWYPRAHHLAPAVPVIGLALGIAYRQYFSKVEENDPKVAGTIVALTLLTLTSLGSLRLFELIRDEERVFHNHVVHNWSLPNGQITSTGQPALINESIELIRKYGEQTSANFLSPWEIVLLPFAGKYQAGPYMVSFDSLLSSEEVKISAEQIVTSPDRMLFVDTRIIRGQYELPLSENAYMQNRIQASIGRLGSHAELRKVFELVRPCYELVEAAQLISVYKRKPTAKWDAGVCKLE